VLGPKPVVDQEMGTNKTAPDVTVDISGSADAHPRRRCRIIHPFKDAMEFAVVFVE
jgi:hypothetical protein